MAKKFLFTFFLSVIFIVTLSGGDASAQKPSASPPQKRLPVFADCNRAIKLSSGRKVSYGPTVAPKGFGKLNEIAACDKQDIFTFEKEHNSAWYYFSVPDDGDVIIEITPVNPKNDYDFMLFKYPDSCFCDDVKQGYILPVRTNLSRSGKEGALMTGLSANAEQKYVPVGQGEAFSKSLPVKQGEKYYLALDNVHPKGDGHSVKIYYLKEITISGTLSDENKKSLPSAVRVEDKNEKIISSVFSNADGNYSLNVKIKDDEYYTLIYTSDSCFTECRQIFINDFSKTNYEQKDLKTTLLKLIAGKKYVPGAIIFSKNSSKLLPTSHSSLNALYELMMKNKTMAIQIEGHVNNPLNPTNTGADKKLGQDKANVVYNYLLTKGIEKERMTAISYGSLFMLFPKPSSPEEVAANNRVEIFFLPTGK